MTHSSIRSGQYTPKPDFDGNDNGFEDMYEQKMAEIDPDDDMYGADSRQVFCTSNGNDQHSTKVKSRTDSDNNGKQKGEDLAPGNDPDSNDDAQETKLM